MKKLLIIAFSLFVTSVFAQMYPKQYALIKGSVITGGKTDWIPYVNNENMVFSQNGNYLFIAHAKQKEEGKIVVYSTSIKDVVKTFKIKKTGLYTYNGKIICNPNNSNQLAIVVGKSEVRVIQNWQTAPEDVLLQKPNENSVSINALVANGQMSFSVDGKSLYIIENDGKALYDYQEDIKSVDLATGKITVIKMPDKKFPCTTYHVDAFIGSDEVIVFNQDKKTLKSNVEVYNLKTNQFVRKFESGVTPQSSIGNPKILFFKSDGYFMSLYDGEKDAVVERIKKSLSGDKSSLDIHYVPGKGFVVAYLYYDQSVRKSGGYEITNTKTQKGLFFFDKNGNNVMGSFPDVNAKIPNTGVRNYQISPNGKYIIFNHDDDKESKNERLVIATL